MSYILANGTTYITKKTNGKFTQTYNMSCASTYSNEAKAWNVLSTLPRAYRENGYLQKRIDDTPPSPVEQEPVVEQPKPKEEEQGTVLGAVQKPGAVSYPVIDSERLAEFKSNLKIVDKTLGELKDTYAKAYQDLTDASNEILDIEHAIELTRPNAVKKCYLESELKKALKKRRESKDTMALVEMVMKFELDDWGGGKLTAELFRLDSRSYLPRCRPDLFE